MMFRTQRSVLGFAATCLVGVALLAGCSSSPGAGGTGKAASSSTQAGPQNDKRALDTTRIEEEKRRFLASQAAKKP